MKDKLIEKQKELIKLLDDALDCMTELGDGKLRQEIWKLESELAKEQEPEGVTAGIDKDWIYEIMDKTNAFAKQLIEDHFNRHTGR